MKKFFIVPVLALLIVGCASFSTNVFRTEQAAITVAYAGYNAWTNYLLTALAKPDLSKDKRASLVLASNEVKQARLRFAATLQTAEAMRLTYLTNSAMESQLRAALVTMTAESSNVCYLIQYWRAQ